MSQLSKYTEDQLQNALADIKFGMGQAIPPESRFNMDETGILEGLGCNGLVLGSSEKKETLKKRLGSRCQDLQHQWFPEELDFLKDWDFMASPKGWTSDSIAIQ
ncbi:hypothetical protein HRG_013810 [Hirsutella rhossiliensis]